MGSSDRQQVRIELRGYPEGMDSPGDRTQPRSTWKVLGGLILAVLFAFLLLGLCVSALISTTPHRTLEVPRRDLEVDLPRFYPLPSFGADESGRTFGVWVVLRDDGSADAFYARDPRSGCYLPWRGDFAFEGESGWFRDPCLGGTYDETGSAVSGPVSRGVDRFDAEVEDNMVTVDLERIRLGECREGIEVPPKEQVPCSQPGNPHYEDEQPDFPDE